MSRAAVVAALLALAAPAPAAAQRVGVEVRTGILGSSPLVEDAVASPVLLASLGLAGRESGRVTLRAAPAPVVVLAVRTALRPDLGLEVSGGWTFTELRAEEEGGPGAAWDVQGLGVGHAVLALRYRGPGRASLRSGVGAIRYATDEEGLFRDGSELEPLLEVGAGTSWKADRVRLSLEIVGQAHGFGTFALRGERGLDGTVYRLGVLAGVSFGGVEP